jgi:hypothetical protein
VVIFVWSSNLVAKKFSFSRIISGISGIRTPTPTYIMQYPIQLSYKPWDTYNLKATFSIFFLDKKKLHLMHIN